MLGALPRPGYSEMYTSVSRSLPKSDAPHYTNAVQMSKGYNLRLQNLGYMVKYAKSPPKSGGTHLQDVKWVKIIRFKELETKKMN